MPLPPRTMAGLSAPAPVLRGCSWSFGVVVIVVVVSLSSWSALPHPAISHRHLSPPTLSPNLFSSVVC